MAFNFGGTTSFGQANAPPFGQQQVNPSSGGAFGQVASPFGTKNTAPQESTGVGGGALGAPQQKTSFGGASNAFGAKPQQETNTFGAAGSSPFGTAEASTSPFGQASANTTTGTFAQPAKLIFGQNDAAPANTGFEAASNTGFGAAAPAFGQQQQKTTDSVGTKHMALVHFHRGEALQCPCIVFLGQERPGYESVSEKMHYDIFQQASLHIHIAKRVDMRQARDIIRKLTPVKCVPQNHAPQRYQFQVFLSSLRSCSKAGMAAVAGGKHIVMIVPSISEEDSSFYCYCLPNPVVEHEDEEEVDEPLGATMTPVQLQSSSRLSAENSELESPEEKEVAEPIMSLKTTTTTTPKIPESQDQHKQDKPNDQASINSNINIVEEQQHQQAADTNEIDALRQNYSTFMKYLKTKIPHE